MFKIFLEGDYDTGKKLADIVRAITKKYQADHRSRKQAFDIRAHLLLYITIDIWFMPIRAVAKKLLTYHRSASKMGQVDVSMITLQMGWRYLLYGGESLSLISQSADERSELIMKNSDYATKYVALDLALLAELTGQPVDQIEGMVCNSNELQVEAESVQNFRLLHHIHFNNLLLAFWRGDLIAAEKSSRLAWAYPTAKMPHILFIYHTFFGGIIAFKLYRQDVRGADADARFKEGKESMSRMGKWAQNGVSIFGNKWLLLQAEHAASINKYDEAKELYNASIQAASDHGNIHELGLANELLGDYHASRGCTVDANASYIQSHMYYMQWGAFAVAKRLMAKHSLDLDGAETAGRSKRSR